METTINKEWIDLVNKIGPEFSKSSKDHDQQDTFVKENYEILKQHHFLSAMIPGELGGEGISHSEMCNVLRSLAQYCGSTALALSMHQHLVAANIWKYKHGKGGEAVLQKVAKDKVVLVSTGARDWLESNGEMEKTEGGYLVTAQKHFASQASIGDILVTSAPYYDEQDGWQVLHFPVPINSEGVTVKDNWYTMGMRGTGSHTIQLEKVFVPESAIVLCRPQGEYHMFWNIVLGVAMPLIMSVYVGIAEKAADMAINHARQNGSNKTHMPFSVGELNYHLTTAKITLKDMIAITNNFDFPPENEIGQAILSRKTIVANSAIRTVESAMEVVGGQSFFRKMELEKLFRDVQAANFHPLPEKQQFQFTGEYILEGKDLNI